ncbi:glycosyltransferase family 4 protein [Virgibacillus sp. NKC19-3]|uniref:glycosyltransferase family 4 protein n=1 Tax=Virgibacillus saliphilus TaxID=2831674 RepID=UPI001C9A49F6|nr:glycosyltransferase family 4 protein [Virgibacillus sp. NKC19-3]MBY7142193.1 glycosyltransferase family 4 protein [Virgibacillus sp. NKC19-3]
MAAHLLVYDYSWWILGQKAKIIQHYHPDLHIISVQGLKQIIQQRGLAYVNASYEVISTLGLGLADCLMRLGVRVDTSQVGSYNYLAKNHLSYREWADFVKPNLSFIKKIKKLDHYGVISPKLREETQRLFPSKKVNFIRPFVDSQRFCPPPSRQAKEKFVIGWVGNDKRKVKNYNSLYRPIVKAFRKDPNIQFIEASRSSPKAVKEMPYFYQALDLLVITSSNEGGPAPALEALSSGVPVLSTNVGYVKHITGQEGKSFVLNSLQPALFAEKINTLKKDKDLHTTLKKEGRARVLTHFTVDKAMGEWLDALFHIKNGKG